MRIATLFLLSSISLLAQTATYTVTGNSISGIIENGDKVLCDKTKPYTPNRGDVIVYPYLRKPIIKKVYGLPGDTFELLPCANGLCLVINGAAAANSYGQQFTVSPTSILDLYAWDYENVIPPGALIILGNNDASEDSRSFGLVAISDLTGKVTKVGYPPEFSWVDIGSVRPIVITNYVMPQGSVGQSYSVTLTASGGVSPYTWTVSNPPAWLTLNNDTLSGTPSTSGEWPIGVTVSDGTRTTNGTVYVRIFNQ